MIDAACTNCQARYKLPETQAGKRVRCKKCQQVFPVETDLEELPVLEEATEADVPVLEEVEEELPVLEEAPRSSLRTAPRRREEERPSRRNRDEEEDRPRRRDLDEDDEPEPVQGGGGGGVVILAILGILLLLGGIGGAIGYYAYNSGGTPVADADKDKKPPEEKKPEEKLPPIDPFKDLGKTDDKGKEKPSVIEMKPIETLDDALAVLRGTDYRKNDAMNVLLGVPRDEARVAEVARAIKPFFGDAERRSWAVRVAGKWTCPELLEELLPLCEVMDLALQTALVHALAKYDDDRATEALVKFLPVNVVKGTAFTELAKMGKKAEKHVLPYLNHKDYGVNTSAEQLLDGYGISEATKRAQTVKDIATDDATVRGWVVKRFARYKPDPKLKEEVETVIKSLEGLLASSDNFLKQDAWKAMEHWAVADSIPAIATALAEQGFTNRTPLINALVRLKDERGAVALLPLLADNDKRTKEAAAKALIAHGDKAEKAVLPLVGSSKADIVELAVVILSEVGGKESVKPLTDLAKLTKTPAGKRFINAALDKIKARIK